MNVIVSNEENFQTYPSIHNINTTNKHHLHRPNAGILLSTLYVLYDIKNFDTLLLSLTVLKNEKAKYKLQLRRYLNTHSFYSSDEFLYVNMIHKTVKQDVYSILPCKNSVHFCICMTFSASCFLRETLVDPWNVFVCRWV